MTDVDIDYSDRDAVKEYLVQKYGENNTCSIGTIGRMKNKSVLIEITRSEGIDLEEVYAVTKGEMKDFGADEEEWTLEQLRENAPSLDRFLTKYPRIEKHFVKLRGLISFWGKHAGGVLVSDESLADQLPVRTVADKVVSCWVEGIQDRELGRMGFIKMDILGIETINQIQMTLDLIEKNRGEKFNMYDLPLDDKRAMLMCNNGDTTGIFQFESYLTNKVVSAMGGIRVFEDYATASALMRPSALRAGLHEKFGKRRNDEEDYIIPDCLEETMGLTYGLTVYQESAYHVAKNLCDFSIVEAYKFMKLLYKGKMTDDKIPYWRDKFYKGAMTKVEKGEVSEQYVKDIFNDLLMFQGYGFCQCLGLDSVLETPEGFKLFADVHIGDIVKAPDKNGDCKFVEVINEMEDEKELFEVVLESGHKLKSSMEHKWLCEDGVKRKLIDIIEGDYSVMVE